MKLEDYVAGRFVKQYEYESFSPAPINHAWIIADPVLHILLGEADRALGALDAFAQLVPDIDFFVRSYVAKEATQSSRIEGTQTNIRDAFKNVHEIVPEKRDDWHEVKNYINAINFAIDRLATLPLSNRLLQETHAILLKGVRGETKLPGEFRQSQNWIGTSLKHASFIPPHHSEVVELMSDLENFLHNDVINVPPLIRIGIAHYQFETIHPFLDGNGRLGRLLISLYLSADSLLVKPALYLSDYFEKNKTEYIDRLMAVRQGNHMDEWLKFFLQGIKESADSAVQVFKAILALKQYLDTNVLPLFSVRRQKNAQALIRQLYASPIVDINDICQLLNVTTNTASSLVKDFVKHKVLVEITGQTRNRLFIFSQYVSLFEK